MLPIHGTDLRCPPRGRIDRARSLYTRQRVRAQAKKPPPPPFKKHAFLHHPRTMATNTTQFGVCDPSERGAGREIQDHTKSGCTHTTGLDAQQQQDHYTAVVAPTWTSEAAPVDTVRSPSGGELRASRVLGNLITSQKSPNVGGTGVQNQATARGRAGDLGTETTTPRRTPYGTRVQPE